MKNIILIFFPLLFIACNTEEIEEKYCSNEIRLFSIPDSLNTELIPFSIKTDSIFELINSAYEIAPCWFFNYFEFELHNNMSIYSYQQKKCYDSYSPICFPSTQTHVSINSEGNIIFERNQFKIDSIKDWFKDVWLLNNENHHINENGIYEEIQIKCKEDTPKDSLVKVFENIIDGFLFKYEELSKSRYAKEICDLTNSEIDSLKSIFPIRIKLVIIKGSSVPPPKKPKA